MKKIMVVDDEQLLRDMISIMLQKEGFEIETAEDGVDFLEKVDVYQPDLVTLDVMMPGLSTYDILKRIKEKKTDPKILLLTVVRFSDRQKNEIFQMGNVASYIKKPFDNKEFIDTVKKLVS